MVVGGIIPPDDAEILRGKGVASVYTPKDYSFDRIMEDLVDLAERQRDGATPVARRAISRHVTGTAPSSMARCAQDLGQVVVVERGGPPVHLVAPPRDAERGRHGMELLGVVRQQVGPAVRPVADRGPLAPVVDVDGQRRPAQGRSRRMGIGLCHQRPLKRQASWIGSCSSGGAGRGHASWTAAAMAARTAGSAVAGPDSDSDSDRPDVAHSGTLPCLRLGSSSRLEARMSRLRQMTRRVSAGEMTSSM